MTSKSENIQIPPEIDKILQRVIDSIVKKEKFVNYEASKKPLGLTGNGFLSVPYLIDIKGTTNEGKKEINLFLKNKTEGEQMASILNFSCMFATERFVYTKLYKLFNQLQDEAKVPAEERFNMVKGYDESNEDMTVLDNAIIKGYKTRDRFEIPPIKVVEISIKQIARLHGLGYVLKTKIPEFYKKEISKRVLPINFNDDWKRLVPSIAGLATKNLPPELKKKAEAFIPVLCDKYASLHNESTALDTIQHGDFRPPNILMKEKGGEVTDAILVDYQMIYCGCPVNDLLFYLYLYSDKDFRRDRMSSLIDLYYSSLTDFLKYFKIDVNSVCPRKTFDAYLKERDVLGIMYALYFYALFYAPDHDVADITGDADVQTFSYDLDKEIQERFNGLVQHFVDTGVL